MAVQRACRHNRHRCGRCGAPAVIDGNISLDMFTDAAVRDPRVLELLGKVHLSVDKSLKASNAGGRPCRVTVRLRNGQIYSREVEHAKGSPEVPMTVDEIKGKFSECARQVLDERSAHRALEAIESLEAVENIGTLARLLMG